jgi:hypothetical protein
MTVLSGSLDSLLYTTYSGNYIGIASTPSRTGILLPPVGGSVPSVSLATTNSPAPGASSSQLLTVVCVDGSSKNVTFTVEENKGLVQHTECILGHSPQGLPLSTSNGGPNQAEILFVCRSRFVNNEKRVSRAIKRMCRLDGLDAANAKGTGGG